MYLPCGRLISRLHRDGLLFSIFLRVSIGLAWRAVHCTRYKVLVCNVESGLERLSALALGWLLVVDVGVTVDC